MANKKENQKLHYVDYKSSKKSILAIILTFIISSILLISYKVQASKIIYEKVLNIFSKNNLTDSIYLEISNTLTNEFVELETFSLLASICLILLICIISIIVAINDHKKNNLIFKAGYIDSLTGLGNSTYFKANGTVFLNNKKSNDNYIISVDIDKFKALNITYGYSFCSDILNVFGNELKELLPNDNITCRMSNDIFVSLFSYNENIVDLLENINNALSTLKVNNKKIPLNLSIGVYKIKEDDISINKVLDKSYLARLQVKGLYLDNYYLFDDKLESQMLETSELESSMKEALAKHEFLVYYQPKVNPNTGKLSGAEALVRWKKGDELIPPIKFIPLFEKNKFIVKLDLYVFEKMCQDMRDWKNKFHEVPLVSVNVSKEHFLNENFIDKYVEICEKYDIKPSEIDLEITESATIDEHIDLLKELKKIKEKGFIISLDDFGTGYSSLSMIQSMPIDIIKVDKLFVQKADLTSDNNIINYIILIAKQVKAKTVIEGVETKEQVDFIKRIQGDYIQGYYYSKPLTKDEFEVYYKDNK